MKNKFFFLPLAFYMLFSTTWHNAITAQSGSLDLTFDIDGKVITAIGSSDEIASDMALQPDGKILICGYSDNGDHNEIAVLRYNTNGTLDNTFSTDGIVTTSIGLSDNKAHALTLQSDGKIVVAGYYYNGSSNDFAVLRYNTDGSLDTSFDNDGISTLGFGENTNDRAFDCAIQIDGKIVVVGYNTVVKGSRDFAVARFNVNGSLDLTFNAVGYVSTLIEEGMDEGRSVAIQTDGKIVVTGFSFDFFKREFATVRYNANGSLDTTFDTDGICTTSVGVVDDAAYDVVLQNDGKIVATGYSSTGSTYEFALVRYNTDGSLDSTFGSEGAVLTAVSDAADVPYALSIAADGKILAAGTSEYDVALVRYNTNGELDATFNTDGIVTTDFDSPLTDDVAEAMLIQPDGKILVAGYADIGGSNLDIVLARYNNNATSNLDAHKVFAGEVTIYPNPFNDQTTLEFQATKHNATIQIFDAMGNKLEHIENVSGNTFRLHRNALAGGIYFLFVEQNNEPIIAEKIIISHD
jgi:uncharacterized delta-60 repeat protein